MAEYSATSVIDSPNPKNLDPFHVGNSDKTNSSLVHVPFNGNNYGRWSRAIRRALGAKNKEGFINGGIKEPLDTDKDYERWRCADYMVTCWILSSMNPDLAEDFEYVTSSIQLWQDVAERFGQSNGPLIYQLKKDIQNLKQENLSLLTYFSKIKRLWDQLKDLRKLPTCVCGAMKKCTCDLFKKLAEFEEEDHLMQFLLGLNSAYENAVTNVLTMEPSIS